MPHFTFPANLVLIVWTLALVELVATASDTTLTDGRRPRRCYACTSLDEENSQCEVDPAAVPHGVLDPCPREVCTIVRVEEWPSRRVKSFYRGCDGRTKVFERNHCQVERGERTCFSACVGDLCNAGGGQDVEHDGNHSGNPLSSASSGCGGVAGVPTLTVVIGWALSISFGAAAMPASL